MLELLRNPESLKALARQFLRFAIVGTLSLVVDYVTMIVLTEVFDIPYMWSTTIAFVAGVVFNYFASMRYVYTRAEGTSRRREFIAYVVLSLIGLGFNDLFMYLFCEFAHIDYRISKLLASALVTMYNFISRKHFFDRG